MIRDPFRLFRASWPSRRATADDLAELAPEHLEPGRYDRVAADAMVDAVHPLPPAAAQAEPIAGFDPSTGWPEAVAFTAHREPGHGGTFARLSACVADRHLLDAVAADRDRLEAVVDRLRAENRRLLERLAARAT